MSMHTNAVLALGAALSTLGAASAASAQVVTIEWVTVGNAGNAADPTTGFGAVSYEYLIGTHPVTNAQYAAFLNAVAASDPNGLYNPSMGSSARGGITRSGSDGSYTYSVKANMGNKPVNFVNWFDAARFCNWMTNGQGLDGGSGDTESGVYTFDGVNSISAITRDPLNPFQVFIPTENEWYKAAYHQPAAEGGDADDYWLYATQSNSVPTVAVATNTGDVANPGADVVNYATGADWNGLNGNVTTVGSAGSTTFYGVSDMNGNVWEWNETLIGSNRGFRGGSWTSATDSLQPSSRNSSNPGVPVFTQLGFRVASPICLADFNDDGMVNVLDVVDFIVNWNAGGPGADFNGDGGINVVDVADFITVWNAGCP